MAAGDRVLRAAMLSWMYAAAITWAREHLDHTVDEVVPIKGGMTSAMLALRDRAGATTVLRLITVEPWRTHGRDLVTRESVTLRTLASIHLVVATPAPRAYESWAWPAKWVVPAWAGRADLWQAAFELLAEDPPDFEPTFLHRDFSPRNLLWAGASRRRLSAAARTQAHVRRSRATRPTRGAPGLGDRPLTLAGGRSRPACLQAGRHGLARGPEQEHTQVCPVSEPVTSFPCSSC